MSNEIENRSSGNLSTFETKDVAFANYVLNLLGPFTGFTGFISIILGYLKRDDARGTYLESHYQYQLRSFWFGALGLIIGFSTIIVFGLGLLIIALTGIWWMVRNAIGLKHLTEGNPVPDPEALLI